jgi:DnaJ-class molecular chaperone
MKRLNPKMAIAEVDCPACNGTGFPPVKPSLQPGRKIFAARCNQCLGKGRLTLTGDQP